MKKLYSVICLLLAVTLAFPVFTLTVSGDDGEKELRGVWVAAMANIDYPSKATTDPEVLKSEALKILDAAEDMGLNAVFLQVRPASDALYKSKLFPWSKYLTGKQGLAPLGGFDPLDFWIAEAHKRGIELHAWINPYRITKKTAKEPKYDIASLDAKNPARLKPEWVVKHTDGNLYYNPGIPEVRKMVVDGALEIIKNYDVDGIHMDDYFYPGKDFNDSAAYAKYGKTYKNINDWRRANVDMLISDLSKAIKGTGKDVSFGISPFGIWANKGENKLGSDTKGLQSFVDQYADSRKWVKGGMLDYIAPQIYWNIGFGAADYSKLLSWWTDVTRGTGVDLYIGQAAYKTIGVEASSPWYGTAEIERQLKLNRGYQEVKGNIFFSYKSLRDNPALSGAVKAVYGGTTEGADAGAVSLSIAKPAADISTAFDKYYFNGTSDPNKPLYLNGALVENRSPKGYFGILVPLAKGVNKITISQAGSSVTRIVNRTTGSSGPEKMGKAEIIAASAFPQQSEYRAPGEKIILSCKAPTGSRVTVRIGGKSYTMKASGKGTKLAGLYADTFTYEYVIPAYTGTPRNIDLGGPLYSMNYNGTVNSCKAPAKVGVIMKGSPFYARVEKDVINTYSEAVSGNGAACELYKGMVDSVTAITGGFARLSLGQWVKESDVTIYTSQTQARPAIKSAVYTAGEWWDSLKLGNSTSAAATAAFDGERLTLKIAAASSAALPKLPSSSAFSNITVSKDGSNSVYALTIKKGQSIGGFYVQNTAEGLVLNIKRPLSSNGSSKPLSGITVMLDPGHGGTDTGATGPLGASYSEKDINLASAVRLRAELEKLGAKVVMTRSTDVNVSLEERLAASRNAKPDMFISLHANSMEDNVDISKVDGFAVFYREKLAQTLAEAVFENTVETLGRTNKGLHNNNFYVTRGTWAPSILVESGFVPNPKEFEWLTGEAGQTALAKSISEAVIRYFK